MLVHFWRANLCSHPLYLRCPVNSRLFKCLLIFIACAVIFALVPKVNYVELYACIGRFHANQSVNEEVGRTRYVSNYKQVEVLDVDSPLGAPNESALIEVIEKKYPHIPFRFWSRKLENAHFYNRTCARMSSPFGAHFNNQVWQTLRTRDGTNFYIYGAYFDDRPLVGYQALVRLLVMIDRRVPPATHCQYWYDGQVRPEFSLKVTYAYIWHDYWGTLGNASLHPFLVSCPVPLLSKWPPLTFKIPQLVSLVERHCENATNLLRVSNERPKSRSGIAVCVKGLNFLHQDLSAQLVEWLELLKLLGCKRVFMYEFAVHPNISKVLRRYENEGFVDVKRLTLPGPLMNIPELYGVYQKWLVNSKRRNEVLPYNDCLYRNLYSYDYMVLLDIDEMILPTSNVYSWPDVLELLSKQTKRKYTALCARHVYFFNFTSSAEAEEKNIPHYMSMLRTVFRSEKFTKPNSYVKCFHDVRRVLTLHNHYPMGCLPNRCDYQNVDPTILRLHHYRKECVVELQKSCQKDFYLASVKDTTIWKYKDDLVRNSQAILRTLGFLKMPIA